MGLELVPAQRLALPAGQASPQRAPLHPALGLVPLPLVKALVPLHPALGLVPLPLVKALGPPPLVTVQVPLLAPVLGPRQLAAGLGPRQLAAGLGPRQLAAVPAPVLVLRWAEEGGWAAWEEVAVVVCGLLEVARGAQAEVGREVEAGVGQAVEGRAAPVGGVAAASAAEEAGVVEVQVAAGWVGGGTAVAVALEEASWGEGMARGCLQRLGRKQPPPGVSLTLFAECSSTAQLKSPSAEPASPQLKEANACTDLGT